MNEELNDVEYYVEALNFAYQIINERISLKDCKKLYFKDYNFKTHKPEDMAEHAIYKALRKRLKLN